MTTEPSDGREPEDPASAPAAPGGLSSGKKIVIAAAGALVLVPGGVLIGSQLGGEEDPAAQATPVAEAPVVPGDPEPNQTPTTPEADPEEDNNLSESESAHADYLEALTPAQREVRESLQPENLVDLSPEQLTALFAIPAGEVTGSDGQIDPELYAEAFTARLEGAAMAGATVAEFDKRGGVQNWQTQTIETIANNYVPPASEAFLGYVGTPDNTETTVMRFAVMESMLTDNISNNNPKEHYRLWYGVNEGTIEGTQNTDGSLDVTFISTMRDNWDTEAAMIDTGNTDPPTKDSGRWTLTGVSVNEDGNVLPADISYS